MSKNEGKVNQKWTEEKIIAQLNDIYTKYPEEFNATFLRKHHNKLMNAAYRKYKNFQNALDVAGINFDVKKSTAWDYESVRNYIEIESQSGCELLSKSYDSSDDKLEIKCKCNETFWTSFSYFKFNKKQQCDDCGLKKSNEIFIMQILNKFNGSIISKEKYRGSLEEIKFVCVEHGEFTSKPNNILSSKHGCPKCFEENHKGINSKGVRYCCVCGSDHMIQEFNNTGMNYCSRHYNQMRKSGKILKRTIKDRNEIVEYEDYAEIVLTDRNVKEVGRALISLNKIDKVKDYKWYLMKSNYVSTRSNGNHMLLHRLIMDAKDDEEVDHKNRIRFDCRDNNLRKCNQSQNAMNSSLSKRNTSGVTGVWRDKRNSKWVAEIFENGKKHSLGRYTTKDEAIEVRKKAELKYFGEFTPDRSEYNG